MHIRGLADLITFRGVKNLASEKDGRNVLQGFQHYAVRLGCLLPESKMDGDRMYGGKQ